MNKKQRLKNRETAKKLDTHLARLAEKKSVCPKCGMQGEYHYVQTRHVTLEDEINAMHHGKEIKDEDFGFYICPSLYDEDGKRKPEHIDPQYASPWDKGMAALAAVMAF